MGRMNIYLSDKEDEKIEKLKKKFSISSKEEVIKRLIKQFPLEEDEFDIGKETDIGDLI